MKEFPHRQYQIIEKLKQSAASSTFVVKPHFGEENSQILKLYTGTSARSKLNVLEDSLRWQRGLVHPHLLGIADAGISGKSSLFTARQFSSSRLDLSKANSTHIAQLLDAVRFLHSHAKPHGSIKPSNLFAIDGIVRLADLRLIGHDESSSLDYVRFTAPEVLLGEDPTFESDFYSLGAVLYRIYARRDPFDDSFPENLKAKYLQARIPPIRDLSGIREPIANAINDLLHRNPRRRASAFEDLTRELPFSPDSISKVPMVGRCDRIEQLHLQVSSATAKTLTVNLIEGEAGIGKSRLIEELTFRTQFHNSEFYTSACVDPAEGSLEPVIRLVSEILRRKSRANRVGIRGLLGSFGENLASLFEGSTEHRLATEIDHPRERIVQDLIGLIGVLSRKETLRLCFEDIDRAEPATRAFLRQVCYRASELNVRMLLTCRNASVAIVPGEMEALLGQAFRRMSIEPLTRRESSELLDYLESSKGKQKRLLNLADGNPFWLLEYARNENSEALTSSVYARIQEETDVSYRKLIYALAVNRAPASADLLARVISLDIGSVRKMISKLITIGAVRDSNQFYEIRLEGLRTAVESDISVRNRRMVHKSLYEALISEKAVTEERLADHAFNGGLWDKAALHFSSLARQATKRGNNLAALDHFRKLVHLLRKLNQEFSPESECEYAICLARSGKPRRAKQIFERLLAQSDINEDLRIRLALLAKGGDIDCSRLDQRLKFLKQAIESSKYGQEHASILLSRLCNASVSAGDLVGASDALQRAQFLLKDQTHRKAEIFIKTAEAFLLMNRGSFREASEIYRTLPWETWSMAAAVLTNRAICLEHMGSIRSAIVYQLKAYRIASKAGHLFARLQCLANLGTFRVKLGEFKEGNRHFDQAKQLALALKRTTGAISKGIDAEQSWLNIMEGRYDTALRNLRTALSSEKLFKRERIQLSLLESEIHFLLGADVKPSEVEQIAAEGSWSDSPLYAVQLALLQSRTNLLLNDALSVLDGALETARQASLLYEVCRLELEIAVRLQNTDPSEAKPHVEEALRIAKKHGYRPLQSRALLSRALCSHHDKEKEHYLGQCFKLASDIGIPEIVSESSYHLGVLTASRDQHTVSREWFAISCRVISEIADQIPARFRTTYLAKSWRKDARRHYEESLLEQPFKLHAVEAEVASRDHRYFRALYRISIAAASARTVDEFLRELLPGIGLSHDSIVVMLNSEGQTTWHSYGVVISDALRHRVLSIANKAGDQARFNTNDRWIPFRSLKFSGGICVVNRTRSQMGEDEMEFFTILGIFVSNSLDQIHNRVIAIVPAVSIAEFHGIVGHSRPTRDLCTLIGRISNNSATVLIHGETGTGKELVARAIHNLSARSKGPFVPLDCGAIAEGLLESELFGSKRGSFTGALTDRPGVFEAAHLGTLFLDEVSNMNLAMQAKLLRVIQEREVRRVGETRNRPFDVRLIAASNTNLKRLVAEGAFRQDLLFRLNVIGVSIPPLRERREDIPVLAHHFLGQLNTVQRTSKKFGAEALLPLLAHRFPGNIRELQNAVERGFFTASGQTIASIPIEDSSGEDSGNEVRKWLADLAEGRRNFWSAIHDRYKRRDISREKVIALIDLGLRTTRGSYKNLASLLRIEQREYRRLMDFLRRNKCHLDFRPYRKGASLS
jgi:transcriptional regulator with PAS, ATPase and Fis domain